MNLSTSRRDFIKTTATSLLMPTVLTSAITPKTGDGDIVGHGTHRYKIQANWGKLDAAKFPVKNCHEMVMDSKGRLIMVTDETKNNILVYDKSGKLLDSWGHEYPGGHGLTLWNANGEEFLFICDPDAGKVTKTDMTGKVLMVIEHPSKVGAYKPEDKFKPTETAIGPNGDIYVADGYGSQWILQYSSTGQFIRKFGGLGDEDGQFSTAHGITVDYRDKSKPTLLITSRVHNAFKRFTLEGKYLTTIFLPGAFVCRPVIHGDHLFAGVCWSRLRYLNQTPNSGFVTILDKDDKVISNPGGTKPEYRNGQLQLMLQDKQTVDGILMHCHDVCIDNDENIYICQWNAKQTYPVKLARI